MSTITLYGTPLSGHVHRVALLLRMLALPYEWVEASADVRQSAAFRRLNPFGQIPVLQDGDLTLADSNAILVYLGALCAGQPLAAGTAGGGGAGAGLAFQSRRRSPLRPGGLPTDRPVRGAGGLSGGAGNQRSFSAADGAAPERARLPGR